jgi:hypothetical protein
LVCFDNPAASKVRAARVRMEMAVVNQVLVSVEARANANARTGLSAFPTGLVRHGALPMSILCGLSSR